MENKTKYIIIAIIAIIIVGVGIFLISSNGTSMIVQEDSNIKIEQSWLEQMESEENEYGFLIHLSGLDESKEYTLTFEFFDKNGNLINKTINNFKNDSLHYSDIDGKRVLGISEILTNPDIVPASGKITVSTGGVIVKVVELQLGESYT